MLRSVLKSQRVQAELRRLQERHDHLSAQLADQAGTLTASVLQGMHKEYGALSPVVDSTARLFDSQQEIKDLEQLLQESDDAEMRQLIHDERRASLEMVQQLQREVVAHLMSKDDNQLDSRNAIVEVRPGAGGEEAALFALDLWAMYQKFAALRGWRFETMALTLTEGGGCKHGSAAISGSDVYGTLKWESGIHRVQRVPTTETSGRVHTSAASVVVLAEADQVDVDLRDEDVRIDTFRASGAGGQHVNTTDSAVRITHIPTGTMVSIQDERSQHKNKAKAFKVLRALLFKAQQEAQQAALSASKMQLAGSGDRSERIRTYNFPQGRVTDHRVGHTEHGIDRVLAGESLDMFIDALQAQYMNERLLSLGS